MQPEVGGLLVRMPLEVELFRNYRHSMAGSKLRRILRRSSYRRHTYDDEDMDEAYFQQMSPYDWFPKAQKLVDDEMSEIAELGEEDGHIDASTLSDERAEVLSLYLDHQETWQEVCLCLERDEEAGRATTLVLNRPMSLKLTDHLARLCLYGTVEADVRQKAAAILGDSKPDTKFLKFMMAFRHECAVYIGGPEDQDRPAEILHGIADLPGAVEISAGTGIYRGGIDAAVDGVLKGLYKPLDFRFFIGRHAYEESMLDVAVILGKYQPIACSRSLVLKQCISLPKPLWHEVLEISGGDMKEYSLLEHSKKDGMQYEIVEDDEDSDDDEGDQFLFLGDNDLDDAVSEALDDLFYDDDDVDDV